jgi:hypothetical protein
MNKYEIVNNATLQITDRYIAAQPMPHSPAWGLERREKLESLCSQEEIDSQESSRVDERGHVYLTLPPTYHVVVTNIDQEIREKSIADFRDQKIKETDVEIAALLGGADDTTHLMMAIYNLYIATNVSGSQTQQEITAAKAVLSNYLVVMGRIQEMRAARDAEIDAYDP